MFQGLKITVTAEAILPKPGRSGRQAGATSCPSAVQYLAAGLGRHAGPETMRSFALDYAGLESSFHSKS